MPNETPPCPSWLLPFFALRRRYTSLGASGIFLAWFLPLIFFWFLLGHAFFFKFPLSILSGEIPYLFLSGEIFTRSFPIQHAGWALDQSTIGKFLLLFGLFSLLCIPYGLIVKKFCLRETRAQKIAFLTGIFLLTFWALSILIWPLSLLFQYIASMGFTFMRLAGLLVAFGSALTWIIWGIVVSRRESSSPLITLATLLALAGPVIIWVTPFVKYFLL